MPADVEYYLTGLSQINYEQLSIADVDFLYRAYKAGFGLPFAGGEESYGTSAQMLFFTPDLRPIAYANLDRGSAHYMLRLIQYGESKGSDRSSIFSQIEAVYQFDPHRKLYNHAAHVSLAPFDQVINEAYNKKLKIIENRYKEKLRTWRKICSRYAKEQINSRDMASWLIHIPDNMTELTTAIPPLDYAEIIKKLRSSAEEKPSLILVTLSVAFNAEGTLMRCCLPYRYDAAQKLYHYDHSYHPEVEAVILVKLPLGRLDAHDDTPSDEASDESSPPEPPR